MTRDTLHIYTRVSTQTQQDEGTSLETQKQLGIKKATELGFKFKVWNEGGASSHYEDFQNRPVLLSLLDDMDRGNIEHLWVYNNDRLSRNEITAQTIRMALQKHGVTLYTQDGQFDLNNPQDKLIKTIFDGLAQFDNALRSERTRLGKFNKVKKGFWMGGPPPFGYQIKEKKLILHPEESKWVKQIYEWYDADKATEWIKSKLDKAGISPRRANGFWSLGSLQKILQNSHPSGTYSYTDSKTDETIKCICPPIVSKTLWNACQEKRKKILARRGQNNRTKRFYLLRNIMYCKHCGSPMSGRIKESKNEYFYYCPRKERAWVKSAPKEDQKWQRGRLCSMTRSLNIKATDELVMNAVSAIMFDPKRLNALHKERTQQKDQAKPKDKDIELKKEQNKQKRLAKELADIIENIADVELAKRLKKQDVRIAKKVLDNLNDLFTQTENQIEQCKVRIQELQSQNDIFANTRILSYDKRTITAEIPLEYKQRHVKEYIQRIDVSYDKEKSHHELVLHFKLPLINGENDLKLNLKKNKRIT